MKQAKQDVTRYVTQRMGSPSAASEDLPFIDVKQGKDAILALSHAAMVLRTGLQGLQACALDAAGNNPEAQSALLWCVTYTMQIGHAVMAAALEGMGDAVLAAEQAEATS